MAGRLLLSFPQRVAVLADAHVSFQSKLLSRALSGHMKIT